MASVLVFASLDAVQEKLLSMGWVDSNRGKVGNSLNEYQQAFSIYQKLANARGQAPSPIWPSSSPGLHAATDCASSAA